jgi:hypothetical protein
VLFAINTGGEACAQPFDIDQWHKRVGPRSGPNCPSNLLNFFIPN